jgi:crotonobetainyl-CoA:carnitine CoA-transferase CaiB-like acyl-CoA transferase
MTDARPRIVDFSTHLSGPVASHLLVELGADVIKVENPRTGDGNRGLPPFIGGTGMLHLALNAGARSLTFNRHSPHWPAVIDACARWADAVIVGTRPKDARQRGLDFATMVKANPRLVYCSLSGFGDAGPWQDYTAHGQTLDAFAGLVRVEPGNGQPRTLTGWRSSGTTLSGVFAALGVMAALSRRDRGVDHAQYVNVSVWASAMWWSWRDVTMLTNTGEMWTEYSDLGSRYSLYRTADDRVVLVAPIEQKFWERFCDIAGLPAESRSFGTWETSGMDHGRGPEYAHERELIAARLGARTLTEWTELFVAADIPFAPVLTIQEALENDHASANGVLRETTVAGEVFRVPATPVRIADSDGAPTSLPPLPPPPGLGEHNAAVLAELGLAELAAEL